MSPTWYVGTDWSKIPAGGNSLRQIFVRLEDYEKLLAALRDVDVSCANVHHRPREYHEGAVNCPVVARIKALLTPQETP